MHDLVIYTSATSLLSSVPVHQYCSHRIFKVSGSPEGEVQSRQLPVGIGNEEVVLKSYERDVKRRGMGDRSWIGKRDGKRRGKENRSWDRRGLRLR